MTLNTSGSPPLSGWCLRSARLQAIIESAGSGKIGDGKIFITQIEEVIRIRTGETNEEAL